MKKFLYCLLGVLLLGFNGANAQNQAAIKIKKAAEVGNSFVTTDFTTEELSNGIQMLGGVEYYLGAETFAPGITSGYTYESIPYSPPCAFNSGTEYVMPRDDCWGMLMSMSFGRPPEPEGTPEFSFSFYGNEYTQYVLGSNGLISFDLSVASQTPACEISCSYSQDGSGPLPNVSRYKNCIYAPYHDVHFMASRPTYPGYMYVQTIGEYPFRKLVVSFYEVPLFGNSSQIATHMVVLNETTNIIEFYLQDKPCCASTNNGYATLGIHNATGTEAVTITNSEGQAYNATQWTAQNEAWRIVPTGQLETRAVEWYKRSAVDFSAPMTAVGTEANGMVNVQVSDDEGPTKFFCKTTVVRTDGNEIELWDSSAVYYPASIVDNEFLAGDNLDFSQGYAGWVAKIGDYNYSSSSTSYPSWGWIQTFNDPTIPQDAGGKFFQIFTDPNAVDSYSNNQLHKVPTQFGCQYSSQINNFYGSASCSQLEYTLLVSPENSLLTVYYALVLENPHRGGRYANPTFQMDIIAHDPITGQKTDELIDDCALFEQSGDISMSNIPAGWHTGVSGWSYCDWQEAKINLKRFEGERVTLRMRVSDCAYYGHGGYAYVAAKAEVPEITFPIFAGSGDTVTVATAPSGFAEYNWFEIPSLDLSHEALVEAEQAATILSTEQNLVVTNTMLGEGETKYYAVKVKTPALYPSWATARPQCESYITTTVQRQEPTLYYQQISETDVKVIAPPAGRKYKGDIVIPERTFFNGAMMNVTEVGSRAFYECDSLTTVVIGDSVRKIGDYSFYQCSLLTSVTFGNSVDTIGRYAFRDCNRIISIDISNSVTTIGEWAFAYCARLSSVVFGNSVNTIGDYAFHNCNYLNSVTIPNSVTSIGNNAFYSCGHMTSVTLGNSVETIGEGAFRYCNDLPSIIIPESVTTIGKEAFYGCSSLTSVTIPNSVETVGEGAFKSCSRLSTVTLGTSVSYLDYDAFRACSRLDTVICLSSTPAEVGFECFKSTPANKTVIVPCGSAEAYAQSAWAEQFSISTASVSTEMVYDTICQGSDYISNGFNLTSVQASGLHSLVYQSVEGCDSIVTLNLTVNPVQSTTFTAEVCKGGDYTEHGFNLTDIQEAGVYTQNLQTTEGCDSIVTLNISVRPLIANNIAARICQGSDYTDYGFELLNVQESGTFVRNLQTSEGCDSVVTLSLVVTPLYETVFEAQICEGEDYIDDNFVLTNVLESGEYTRHYDGTNGCDSVVKLILSVNPLEETYIMEEICQGSDYISNGFELYNVQHCGIYTQSLQSVTGCDSIVTLNLAVKPVYEFDITATVCQDETYNENGFNVVNAQESGSYTLHLQTVDGCDSIVNLHLTVYPVYGSVSAVICQGEDYMENGFSLTNVQESGIFTQRLQGTRGCDSIVTLDLTVKPTFETVFNARLCQGGDYLENGFNLMDVQESGVHTQRLRAENGCDSIVTLNLAVNPAITTTLYANVCQGSDYVENGFNIINVQQGGAYVQNLQTIRGCDSIVTLYLTVNPVYTFNISATICQGSDYTENGFNLTNVQESGVYTQVSQGVNGCENTVILNLTVKPVSEATLNETICQGEDYVENGFYLTDVEQSGVFTRSVRTSNGCDSLVTLNLTVNPVYATSLSATVCQGNDYMENGFNLTNLQEGGIFTQHLQSVGGCDSIVTLSLAVVPSYSTTLSATLCQGGDYTENGFNITNVQESGVYTQNLQTVNGCDSTVTLYLSVNAVFSQTIDATVCQGESYIENGFFLSNLQQSGVYTQTLRTESGCDSVVTLNLRVNPVYEQTLYATVCQGSDYMENGFSLTNLQQSGVFTQDLQTESGCDSTITLYITVNPVHNTTLYANVCRGNDYFENGFSLTDIQQSGVYTQTLQSENGCDSTVTLILTVNPIYSINLSATVCQGGVYTDNGFNLTDIQESGVYTQTLQTTSGCDSIITLNLTVNPVFTRTINDTICEGETYMDNGFYIENVDHSEVFVKALRTIEGCDSIIALNLYVNPVSETTLYATICQGNDYTDNGFNLTDVQQGGVHTLNLHSANGCDSIVTLNLTVKPSYEITISASVGAGSDYTDNGFIITNVQESGTHTRIYTATNGCDSLITLHLNVYSGLAEAESAKELTAMLYPNPAEDYTVLKIDNLMTNAELVVFDMQGRVVIRQSVAEGEEEIRIDLRDLSAGTYSVRITNSEGMITRKLIKH